MPSLAKKFSRSLLWAGILLFRLVDAHAQNLHFFSVVETNDINRTDRIVDMERVEKTGSHISQFLGLDELYYNFGEDNAFSVGAVRATLARLGTVSCANDVIWFHFSGYGRNDGLSAWPVLKLTDGEIQLTEIISALQRKRPKFLLVTVEAGNKKAATKELSNQTGDELDEAVLEKMKGMKRTAISPRILNPMLRQMPHFSKIENYERLFTQFSGQRIVILGSCSVGQNSISNATSGSEWLISFCRKFDEITEDYARTASWEGIHGQVTADITKKLGGKQKPQASIKTIASDCGAVNDESNE